MGRRRAPAYPAVTAACPSFPSRTGKDGSTNLRVAKRYEAVPQARGLKTPSLESLCGRTGGRKGAGGWVPAPPHSACGRPQIEVVVEEYERYIVVEKVELAAEAARKPNPRARGVQTR